VVNAFFAAARYGEFETLVGLLHPDVTLRADFSPGRPNASVVIRGAQAVARQARVGANLAADLHPAMVNGSPGVVITLDGRPHAVMAFTVAGDRIVAIDVIGDPERVGRVAAPVLAPG
jgi:RNA polymerase sigma-70 factor (ECF subfamily)